MEDYYHVKTAGIVLLNNYIPILFDRLGLVSAKQFKCKEDREKAAFYLQYLATGNETNEEKLPALNMALAAPVDKNIKGITFPLLSASANTFSRN